MAEPLNNILLVDDDKVTNLMHKRLIFRGGFSHNVDVATDGRAALEYLAECIDENKTPPELILLDINMPRMNGFEFLEKYAQLPEALREGQSVFMVSTSTLKKDRLRAEKFPMVAGYESKPVSAADIEHMVDHCRTTGGASAR